MSECILDVPYLIQPTGNTCQSTCLKMFGMYLEAQLGRPASIAPLSILDIWSEINEGKDRPSRHRNDYQNMAWWLQRRFPDHRFGVNSTRDVDDATQRFVRTIDNGFPVIVSTNHSRTAGHIILVIGYIGAESYSCAEAAFVCHDPNGRFHPSLHSQDYGRRRVAMGVCLASGGQVGPGKAVVYDHQAIHRIRSDQHSSGTYFLISAIV